ncbi:hypothetical protein V8G54_031381 [Vigna mungo]|uniref:Uncharacterized protein n=1 Tax=Vigna mungo TaxID=3915 RepID=A0AAQ3MY10_VIGMU
MSVELALPKSTEISYKNTFGHKAYSVVSSCGLFTLLLQGMSTRARLRFNVSHIYHNIMGLTKPYKECRDVYKLNYAYKNRTILTTFVYKDNSYTPTVCRLKYVNHHIESVMQRQIQQLQVEV